MADKQARLVLIAGLPGTGKTVLGNHLESEFGFEHRDFERSEAQFPTDLEFLAWKEYAADIVVTWGFLPIEHDRFVRELLRRGFRFVWFAGSEVVARRIWIERGRQSGEPNDIRLFDAQLVRIRAMSLKSYAASVLDPFTANGKLKPKEERAAEVLAIFDSPRSP